MLTSTLDEKTEKWKKTRPYREMWSDPKGSSAKAMREEFEYLTRNIPNSQKVTFYFVVCRLNHIPGGKTP